MPVRDIVIRGAARPPIGRYGGSLEDVHPAELDSVTARAAIERTAIVAPDLDEGVVGLGMTLTI